MGLRKRLIEEEGLKLFPYKDTKGIWTIGVGHNIEEDLEMLAQLPQLKIEGITESKAMEILDADILVAKASLARNLPWIVALDCARRDVLIDMTFNMGIGRLLKFKNALDAIQHDRWAEAKAEMLDSLWAKQVKGRAIVLADIMESGEDDCIEGGIS